MNISVDRIVTKIAATLIHRLPNIFVFYRLYYREGEVLIGTQLTINEDGHHYWEIDTFTTKHTPSQVHRAILRWLGFKPEEFDTELLVKKLQERTPNTQKIFKQMVADVTAADPDELPSTDEADSFVWSDASTDVPPFMRVVTDISHAKKDVKEDFTQSLDEALYG
jgi:hypothetical protein